MSVRRRVAVWKRCLTQQTYLPRERQTKIEQKTNMRKSILDQFAADAINAPETVTGGRRGRGRGHGGTRTRTRGNGVNAMMAANRRGRGRTRTRTRQG
jgi:hypothetical protein